MQIEKAMATHSSTLAWKIPWTEEPGSLQSMGSLRVGHDWGISLRRNGVAIMVNKRVRNAVLGCNLKNYKRACLQREHFQWTNAAFQYNDWSPTAHSIKGLQSGLNSISQLIFILTILTTYFILTILYTKDANSSLYLWASTKGLKIVRLLHMNIGL